MILEHIVHVLFNLCFCACSCYFFSVSEATPFQVYTMGTQIQLVIPNRFLYKNYMFITLLIVKH